MWVDHERSAKGFELRERPRLPRLSVTFPSHSSGLSAAKLAQLRLAARNAIQDPGFVNAMATMNTPIRFLEGAELNSFLEQDQKRLAGVIKAMGKLE